MTIAVSMRLPTVIRSQQHLLEQGVRFTMPDAVAPMSLPISTEGVTFDMAQAAAWVDAEHFAVGRWDGSLTLFRFSESKSEGPLITVAASTPSSEGVQMIAWIADRIFAASNDEELIAVWRPNAAWNRLELVAQLRYDPEYGAANSGEAFALPEGICMVVGHAHGFVTIWTAGKEAMDLSLKTAIDVRNNKPTNPWGIHNVRGIAAVEFPGETPCALSGSEDGGMCLIRVPDGKILSRIVFNPQAERGINSVAANGPDILIANCSVGVEDRNLWLFTVDSKDWTIVRRDAINLRVKADAPQVFNFAVVWGEYENGRCFFSSTQEGALWMGIVRDGKLSVFGYQQVTAPLGAALAYASNGNLAFAAYDLYEFKTLVGRTATTEMNPHRFSGRL